MLNTKVCILRWVRQNLAAWINKLECNGNVEKQHEFKKKFIHNLKTSAIAIETDKANEQHYEVPTEFYLTALGKRLKYSGCYYPEGVTDLDQAEEITLKQYCERAKIEDGQTVLDLGCGWGSFGLYVCEKYPRCHVTCVSNSSTQREYIVQEGVKRGYGDRLECITNDANYFNTAKRFDRIVSIEMFEHMKNYELLFQRVSTWLKPAGLLFIQILCHKQHAYNFDTKKGSDTEWMAKNFFSGGTMPSVDLFLYFQNNVSIVENWIINGTHYSKTLEAWLEKMDANKTKVKEIFTKGYGEEAKKQIFNFRLFFIFCSEVFGYRDGNEWLVAQYLFKKKIPSAL
ncbi:hypothetical protein LOTGIDRAFT_230578 [Lottia gigantea]|uniref:Methyltransferase domain-containing protein n=1 Tax=Lottia gigantea TaxID=225164 RepID=V4CJ16_LOTGI|nr:hypothetical protein LOTGIDRAFT_230578 [Lottia gigantea]ESP02190.1 hypothetical protein LOTGIDRAFT_230578 [Lottia gigantea]